MNVELALKANPDDSELLKLKQDLEELIQITAELLGYDASILNSDDTTAAITNQSEVAYSSYSSSLQSNSTTTTTSSSSARSAIKWKTGDRCLAPWNEDGKYYECTIDDVLDDGTCTIIFDGFESAPLTVVRVSKLKPFDRTRPSLSGIKSAANRAKTKRELEQRLRELKRRKKEKKIAKLKQFEEEREKDKKRWNDFNLKLTSRTWKGVVSKSMVKTDKRTEQLRGKPLLVADDYTFKLNKTTTSTKYWICTINGCAAKVHTDLNNGLMKTVGYHSHLPEKEKLEVRELREKIKQRAINETTPIPRIYDEECTKAMLSNTAIAILPSEREMTCSCVFGLLSNRQKSTYHFMFRELKALAVQMEMNFSPKLIMSDFEPGLLAVVTLEVICYSNAFILLFSFYSSYLSSKATTWLISTAYNNDDDIKKYCRKMMALPLIPETIIEDTYDELIATMPSKLKDLLRYFQKQWLNKVPISQWCVHGLNIRTNNNAEAFHSRFYRRVQIDHPNIWSFIKLFQGEENRFHHMYVQFMAGLGTRSKQAKTVAIQLRIDKLGERYYNVATNAMEYLDSLSFVVAKRKK
ncbi:unnamed protein product [Rotaria magnacalcarata]|uniref:Tudor domain-containing protein n=1 Tax=Rotaria magnacalcarata TaxID=392030 RepID=A0A814VST5_9BILA|nr:unnamed protein product [Rotaria magnacalcarata]